MSIIALAYLVRVAATWWRSRGRRSKKMTPCSRPNVALSRFLWPEFQTGVFPARQSEKLDFFRGTKL